MSEHHPVHEQIMLFIEGAFKFTLDGDTKVFHSGEIVPIASNLHHSGKVLTPAN